MKTLFLIGILFFGETGSAFKTFHPGRFGFGLNTFWLKTTENLGFNGKRTDLSTGSFLQILGLDLNSHYDWNQYLTSSLKLSMRHGTSNNGSFKRKRFGLTDLKLTTRFIFLVKPVTLSVEAMANLPLTRIDFSDDRALINEGTFDLGGKLFIEKWFSPKFKSHLIFGLVSRDDSRSWLFPWSLGFSFHSTTFFASLEIFGHTFSKSDGQPQKRIQLIDKVNAGSFKYYAADPMLVSGRLGLGWRLNKAFHFFVNTTQSLQGARSAFATTILAGFQFNFQNEKKRRQKKYKFLKEFELKNKKEDDGFEFDTPPDMEEELFKDDL